MAHGALCLLAQPLYLRVITPVGAPEVATTLLGVNAKSQMFGYDAFCFKLFFQKNSILLLLQPVPTLMYDYLRQLRSRSLLRR